jgi:hypothetical protein
LQEMLIFVIFGVASVIYLDRETKHEK